METRAVIFDFDGTIIDSFDAHADAYVEVLKRKGIKLDKSEIAKRYGKTSDEILSEIKQALGVDFDVRDVSRLKNQLYPKHAEKKARLLPGAKKLLEKIRKKHKTAVASSSKKKVLKYGIRLLGIDGLFDIIVGAEDAQRGKPMPDLFLKAAEKLGTDPEKCVVVEDSVHGIQAAKNAKMRVIAVSTGTHGKKMLKKLKPDIVVNTLEDKKIYRYLNLE